MDIVDRSPLLRALPDAQRLLPHLELLCYERDEPIVREGDGDRDLYFVLAGSARILRQGLDAGRVRAGEHFGELALAVGQPRAATIVANEAIELARLSSARFEQLAAEQPTLALRLLRWLLAGAERQSHRP